MRLWKRYRSGEKKIPTKRNLLSCRITISEENSFGSKFLRIVHLFSRKNQSAQMCAVVRNLGISVFCISAYVLTDCAISVGRLRTKKMGVG